MLRGITRQNQNVSMTLSTAIWNSQWLQSTTYRKMHFCTQLTYKFQSQMQCCKSCFAFYDTQIRRFSLPWFFLMRVLLKEWPQPGLYYISCLISLHNASCIHPKEIYMYVYWKYWIVKKTYWWKPMLYCPYGYVYRAASSSKIWMHNLWQRFSTWIKDRFSSSNWDRACQAFLLY